MRRWANPSGDPDRSDPRSFFHFKQKYMSLRLGDKAPNFQAKTSIGDIDFYEYLGDSWGILFSHPADYTPVCTTELGRTAALKDEFAKRGVKVLALSVDPVDKHLGWIKDINETQKVKYLWCPARQEVDGDVLSEVAVNLAM